LGFVVAIDGPAASGKGTIATRLGAHLGLPVLDSGLLYRATGAAARAAGIDLEDEDAVAKLAAALDLDRIEDPDLRTAAMGEAASRVAIHAGVREALFSAQRAFAERPSGAVIDGRDIGTVICPDAPAKLFVTASPEARAQRRWRQLTDHGEPAAYADILADIVSRDARDSGRTISPLLRADDAVLLDTTDMSIDAAFDAARRIVEAARARLAPD
jgi:cytidylate kinase